MRTHAPLAVSIFSGLLALALDGPARASIQSPPEEACAGKSVGDACSLPSGESGACKSDKCKELDYSQGSPPKSVEVDCVVCVAGEPPGPGPVAVGGEGGGDGGPAAADGGNATGETAPTAAPTSGGAPADKEPPSSEARCSVSGQSGVGGAISLLGLALVARRRRRAVL